MKQLAMSYEELHGDVLVRSLEDRKQGVALNAGISRILYRAIQ